MLMLDLRGLRCPLPVLRARKKLRMLGGGDEICVLSTDPLASVDIPHMAAEDGHALVRSWREGEATAFLLRKAYRATVLDEAGGEPARSTNMTIDRPVTS